MQQRRYKERHDVMPVRAGAICRDAHAAAPSLSSLSCRGLMGGGVHPTSSKWAVGSSGGGSVGVRELQRANRPARHEPPVHEARARCPDGHKRERDMRSGARSPSPVMERDRMERAVRHVLSLPASIPSISIYIMPVPRRTRAVPPYRPPACLMPVQMSLR